MPTSCGLWKTNESLPPSGGGIFPSGAHRLCLGWWVWNKISHGTGLAPLPGDRRAAELTMEVPGGSRGLYRGYVLGERGLMDLGTLLPEGNVLRLRRTFPVERLRSQGCWPVTGAGCR